MNAKPAKCESKMMCEPICPCEILANGFPGSIEINGVEYAASVIGSLPPAGEPIIDGFRLTKANGECHDICIVAGRYECTCGDYEFRRSAQQARELQDCKHIIACKRHLLPPRDLCPRQPSLTVAASQAIIELETL